METLRRKEESLSEPAPDKTLSAARERVAGVGGSSSKNNSPLGRGGA